MTITAHTPDRSTVVLTAHLAQDPATVFGSFVDPAALATWYWPPRLEPTYAVEASVGGAFRIRSDVADLGVRAVFTELTPPERLALDWQWDGDEAISTVVVDLVPDGDGTALTLTHAANSSEEQRDLHRQGWTDCLGRLQQLA